MKRQLAITAFFCLLLIIPVHGQPPDQPKTILNLYDAFGYGKRGTTLDWGYSALVHYNGKAILFDSGNNTAIFEHNVKALAVDQVGAYFLDIVGGWMNNPQADMHEGTRRLVADLRAKFPNVVVCGEMAYDALLAFISLYHVFTHWTYPQGFTKYARAFQHLSHPAPGRGSSGVHEWGFSRFDPQTLALNEHQIPTLNIVDDTFDKHRGLMTAIIQKAKERAGIS